jgi:pantoate--beta-alanine ligase
VQTLKTVRALKQELKRAKSKGQVIALVPTMGALHEGHLSLIEIARANADVVVASIFVNPAQFGPKEDLKSYPRNTEKDAEKLRNAGCDILFAPPVEQIYPIGFETQVALSKTTQGLCGAHRPGHFDGVTTVVMKLFGITGPDVAVFGEKDFQQLAVIRRMVEDLCLDIKIIGAPLIREKDGLAMSSRNAYLNEKDRQRALAISRGLYAAKQLFEQGERAAHLILTRVRAELESESISPEYLELRSCDRLTKRETIDENVVLLVAAQVGSTRLIDNMKLLLP